MSNEYNPSTVAVSGWGFLFIKVKKQLPSGRKERWFTKKSNKTKENHFFFEDYSHPDLYIATKFYKLIFQIYVLKSLKIFTKKKS